MRNRLTSRAVFQRYLTEDEERQLLRYIAMSSEVTAQRDHAWIRLLRHTGIRVGSLVGLTVGLAREAVRTGMLHLPDAICKGERGYDVVCSHAARTALNDLLKVRAAQGHKETPDAPLLMSRKKRRLSIRMVEHAMRSWAKHAGLVREVSPHWLRHTLAKRILKKSPSGNADAEVMLQLGHSNPRSTAVYSLPSIEDMREALEAAA